MTRLDDASVTAAIDAALQALASEGVTLNSAEVLSNRRVRVNSSSVADYLLTGQVVLNVPFVCQRGFVSLPTVNLKAWAAAVDVIQCPKHTLNSLTASAAQILKNSDDLCWRHPLFDQGLLAAYALGGIEAIESKERRDLNGWLVYSDVEYSFKPKYKHAFSWPVMETWRNAFNELRGFIERHDEGHGRRSGQLLYYVPSGIAKQRTAHSVHIKLGWRKH